MHLLKNGFHQTTGNSHTARLSPARGCTGGRERHKYQARQAASARHRRRQREGTRRQGRRTFCEELHWKNSGQCDTCPEKSGFCQCTTTDGSLTIKPQHGVMNMAHASLSQHTPAVQSETATQGTGLSPITFHGDTIFLSLIHI